MFIITMVIISKREPRLYIQSRKRRPSPRLQKELNTKSDAPSTKNYPHARQEAGARLCLAYKRRALTVELDISKNGRERHYSPERAGGANMPRGKRRHRLSDKIISPHPSFLPGGGLKATLS